MSIAVSERYREMVDRGKSPVFGPKSTLDVYAGCRPVKSNTLLLHADKVRLRPDRKLAGYRSDGPVSLESVAIGTAGCFRLTSDDPDVWIEGDVGTSSGDMRFNSVALDGSPVVLHKVFLERVSP